MSLLSLLARRKSVEQLQAESYARHDFARTLGFWQLTALGLGGIIGVGVFVLAGQQAALNAGPAIALSFVVAGIGSAAAALCYAEFVGLIPGTGSSYTYSYAVLGEGVAWIIGWDLLLEYSLVVAVVAIGWSAYVQVLLASVGLALPVWARGAVGTGEGHIVNLIAMLVTWVVAAMLTIRTQWGVRFNTVFVTIKVVGILLVIGVGATLVDTHNWQPFVPPPVLDDKGVSHYGWSGVLTAAGVVFFAVFGYDTITTAAEEARNPQRDLPRAVLLSLAIALCLYVAVSLVLTGMVPYAKLGGDASISDAFKARELAWMAVVVAAAAVVGVVSVLFAFLLGAARIWYAMARDGLLPPWATQLHKRFQTPHRPTLVLGLGASLAAGALPIGEVAELVNIGTLVAFTLICASVLVLRLRRPDLPREFRTPALWLVAPLGVVFSLALMSSLPAITWLRFALWLGLGLAVYFSYGMRHSHMAQH